MSFWPNAKRRSVRVRFDHLPCRPRPLVRRHGLHSMHQRQSIQPGFVHSRSYSLTGHLYSLSGGVNATCKACPANGSCTCPSGVLSCPPLSCNAGFGLSSDNSTCVDCHTTNQYSPGGTSSCSDCPSGQSPTSNAAGCSAATCGAGTTRAPDGSCVPCPSGQYSTSGANPVCTSCPANATCRSCDAGDNTCNPVLCSPGYGFSGGTCTACTSGHYSHGGTPDQSLPGYDSWLSLLFVFVGLSTCQPCTPGLVSNNTASVCVPPTCAPGTGLVTNGSGCEACDVNQYAPGGEVLAMLP